MTLPSSSFGAWKSSQFVFHSSKTHKRGHGLWLLWSGLGEALMFPFPPNVASVCPFEFSQCGKWTGGREKELWPATSKVFHWTELITKAEENKCPGELKKCIYIIYSVVFCLGLSRIFLCFFSSWDIHRNPGSLPLIVDSACEESQCIETEISVMFWFNVFQRLMCILMYVFLLDQDTLLSIKWSTKCILICHEIIPLKQTTQFNWLITA